MNQQRTQLTTETFFDRYDELWTVIDDTWAGVVTCESADGVCFRWPRDTVQKILERDGGHQTKSVRVQVARIAH